MQPPQPRQHPDIQMLQRQIMFRQLQEMQQKQQLDEYSDPRQQNYMNQLSLLNKQAYGTQLPALIKSTPVGDASQVAMAGNTLLMQHGASPIIQGFSQGLFFSKAQSHALSSVSVAPQQFAGSFYGTPITTGNNLNQYSHIQGASPNFGNMLARGNNSQVELPIMQQSNFSNSFVSEQYNPSSEQGYTPDGAFVPKHVFQVKNSFGQVPVQGSHNESLPGNFQQINTTQRNGAIEESKRRQDQAGWPGRVPMIMPGSGPSRGTATLDPLEEKILFNTDDISWEASLGGQNHLGVGAFDSTQADPDNSCLFPSIQSGSWSALMQSAVAEASSTDTGAQEDWSGLSFQNPEISIDYQPSTNMDSGKQQSNWVDNHMQIGSPSSKPQLQSHNMHMDSCFTGFQQSNYQSLKQRDGVCSDSSHGSVQQSPQNANKWSDCSSHQKHSIAEGHLAQISSPSQNNWPMQPQERSRSDAQHRNISSYTNIGQAGYELRGNVGLPGPASWPAVPGKNQPPNQGLLPTNQRNSKSSEELQHQSSLVSNSVRLETSAGLNSPSATTHSREKMLDLLNKDEDFIENGSEARFAAGDSIPLHEMPQPENSDASLAHSYSDFSVSQGFGLFSGSHDEKMSKSYSSHQEVENFSATLASRPPYLNSQLQIQHLPAAPVTDQSPLVRGPDVASRYPAFGSTSKDVSNMYGMNHCGQETPILETIPVTQPSATKGVSWKTVAPNLLSVIPKQPSVSNSEPNSAPSNSLPSPDSATSSLQNSAGASHYHHHQSSTREGNDFHRMSVCSGKTEGFDCREELLRKVRFQNPPATSNAVSENRLLASGQEIAKHFSNANASTSSSVLTSMHQQVFSRAQQPDNRNQTVSAGDFEAFGRSLRPSLGLHQNIPLLHQAHSLKNVERDPRMRLSEIDHGHKLAMRTLSNSNPTMLSQLNSYHSADDKLLSSSSEAGGDQSAKAPSRSFLQRSQETVLFGHTDTESHSAHSSAAPNTKEQAQITAQMAASGFKHYGTLKDGRILSIYNTQATKDGVQHLSAGRPFPNLHLNNTIVQVNSVDASQGSNIWPTMATTSVVDKLSPLYGLPQNLTVPRPKKRKVAALSLLPWHKQMTQGSARLLNISKAEAKWASATNRLKDKLEDDAEVTDNVIPISGAKKRLRLATQLMQLVFQPAPATILSEANPECVSIIYFEARSALGDACGLISDSDIPSDCSNMPTEELKSPERPNKQDFSKSLEDFICLAKRLESDFLRVERRASFVDLKAESQELEKFSIINRLAKFHSRGQTAATDASFSAGPSIPKPFPQRYVVALPMPRTVPEGASCLSL